MFCGTPLFACLCLQTSQFHSKMTMKVGKKEMLNRSVSSQYSVASNDEYLQLNTFPNNQ